MNMVKFFIKKPIIVRAIKFTGDNYKECEYFIGKENYDNTLNYPNVKTLEGVMEVSKGDYIICGTRGEYYPCKPNVFEDVYSEYNG